MNGTKLRNFSHFQILTKIAQTLAEVFKLTNFEVFIHCKTVKISQNHQI